jgi:hypothetical protein
LVPRWRGGELPRLLDHRHAQLGDQVTRHLVALDWVVRPEVSFSRYGERGSVDLLAWHPASRTVLVCELKTMLVDLQGLVTTVDRKARLAGHIAGTAGWTPVRVGVLVVVSEGRTNRRRVSQHRALLRAAYPDDGRGARRWLRLPTGPFRGLAFWPTAHGRNAGPGSGAGQRVSRARRDRH